jgi:hypothetical protein
LTGIVVVTILLSTSITDTVSESRLATKAFRPSGVMSMPLGDPDRDSVGDAVAWINRPVVGR